VFYIGLTIAGVITTRGSEKWELVELKLSDKKLINMRKWIL